MRIRCNQRAGFTLLEMMIVVAILGVLTAQLFVVFANQKRVFMSNERALDVQESSRLTLDLVSFDARMAGFMVPTWTAVSSQDGGTAKSDRLCVSSLSSFVQPGTPSLDEKVSRFNGAQVTAVSTNSVSVDSTDLDGAAPTPDFQVGAGVIVASASKTYCGIVATVTANQITFASTESASTALGAVTPDMRAVPANVYVLDEGLMELRRNGLLLASQIEDFQVEYWLDNKGLPNGVEDGDGEFPVNNLASPDPPGGAIPASNGAIRRVRVSVTARTIREESAGARSFLRPALANRIAGTAADNFRRRTFSASILPRNLVAIGDNP